MKDLQLAKVTTIRMTLSEHRAMREAARKDGRSLSAWLRQLGKQAAARGRA